MHFKARCKAPKGVYKHLLFLFKHRKIWKQNFSNYPQVHVVFPTSGTHKEAWLSNPRTFLFLCLAFLMAVQPEQCHLHVTSSEHTEETGCIVTSRQPRAGKAGQWHCWQFFSSLYIVFKLFSFKRVKARTTVKSDFILFFLSKPIGDPLVLFFFFFVSFLFLCTKESTTLPGSSSQCRCISPVFLCATTPPIFLACAEHEKVHALFSRNYYSALIY